MQQPKRPGISFRTRRRHVFSAKWFKAAALALALVLCFAVVWFVWLQPANVEPAPSITATPMPTGTLAATPYPSVSPSPVSMPTQLPTPTPLPQAVACSPGDTGAGVEMVQVMLISLGFDAGEADGIYGEQLEAAVRNFQLYAQLSADGIAGVETAAALTQRWQAAQQPINAADQPLAGCVIGIDPGHQRVPNNEQEPISPGSTVTKDKVSKGTEGQFTGVPEYAVNLQVALKLKAALEALGAQVVMTRETHGVDIPNSQRAQMMNEANVDCWLRIHANYSPNPKDHGMFILVPSEGGLDTDDPVALARSVLLAETLLESTIAATGADSNRYIEPRDDQTGFGWSQMPVCNIEMGYMSNEAEDKLLVTEAYQQKIVEGLEEGFIRYFSELKNIG